MLVIALVALAANSGGWLRCVLGVYRNQIALIAEPLKSDPQLSNREHERRTGASRNTVGRVREEMESSGQLSQSDSRVSGDGRVRPASQPKREPQPESAPGITSEEVDELNQLPTEQPTIGNLIWNRFLESLLDKLG